jgi:NAD(P)-dependent dehydrogenase (short-subunit alcohol dehydrogenase family)
MASKPRTRPLSMTGGSAGIGLGIAKRFAQEDAVLISGRRQSELDKPVASIGGAPLTEAGMTGFGATQPVRCLPAKGL